MKKFLTLTSIFAMLTFAAPMAYAAEVETICETNSYGEQSCYSRSTDSDSKTEYVRVVETHDITTVDTALDTKGKIAAFGIMAAGVAVAVNKFRKAK